MPYLDRRKKVENNKKLRLIKKLKQKIEVPKIEVPKSEVPKSEVPKSEVPKSEVPKIEVPKSEVPKIEVPKSEVPKSEVQVFELMYDYNQLSNYLSLTKFRHSQLWMIKQRQVCADLKTKYGFKIWLFRFKKVMKHFKSLSEYPKWRYEIKECLTELKQYINDKNVKKKVNNYKKMCCGLFV